jgi:YggT family protein
MMEALVGPVEWLVSTVLSLALFTVIVSAVLSWLVAFNVVNTRNRFVATVWDTCNRLTEPLLNPIRKVIPSLGGVDLSPVVLIIGIQFVQNFAVPLIPF